MTQDRKAFSRLYKILRWEEERVNKDGRKIKWKIKWIHVTDAFVKTAEKKITIIFIIYIFIIIIICIIITKQFKTVIR